MPTTEELLEQLEAEAQSETPVCVIDPETRTITVPPEYQLLGVENDKRVERILFRCPKIVGDNQDLSQDYILFINYVNANGDPDAYKIEDMQVEGDNITFSWLLEEKVTLYQGNIQISFCGIIPGDEQEDPDKNRWNTTINTDCTCLVGLKSTQQVAESNPDALVQIWAAIDELKAGGGGSGTPGKDGVGIDRIEKTNTQGLVDTYTIYLTDDRTYTFTVTNGKDGNPGAKGDPGQTGATPNIQIGTVQTLEPGQQATASMTGTPENPLLNLGIPKGGGGVDPEQIKQAVNGYLEEHPPSGMTAEEKEQLDKNTENISSLSDGLVDVDFKAYNDSGATIKSGTYMNPSTDGLAGSVYCTTDFVKIPSFAKTVSVILSEALTKSDNATMKVYDESKNALASEYLGTGATKCTIDLPEGAKYWRVSVASTATTVQVNYIKDTNGVIPLAEEISANKEAIYAINNPFLSFSKEDVQYPTKALWDNRSVSVGSTLPAEFNLLLNQGAQYFAHRQRVYTGERIEFDSANPPVNTTINRGMVVTDDNFVVLAKISYETIRYSGYEFAQDGYFYVSYGITDETQPLFRIRKHLNFYEIGSTIDNAKKELPAVVQEQLSTVPVGLLTEEYLLDAVSSVICIGDSVTEGVTTGASGIRRDLSYPARLSKMTGWTIENAGAAGLTTLQWWQNKFSSYTYSDYQTAIIELGYNGGLTDTIEVDTAGDNYEEYADTNTGAYCKIIEGMKAQNSKIFIVLIISPGFSANVANVVMKIAEKYSLSYIDLRDVSYVNLQDDKYHGRLPNGNMDYTHMNAVGYLAKAEFIRTALVKIFAENIGTINALAIAWES